MTVNYYSNKVMAVEKQKFFFNYQNIHRSNIITDTKRVEIASNIANTMYLAEQKIQKNAQQASDTW